ncbi:MAG: NAD(+)/NADH kinase [Actinobacteria bacterium]|nr:NAD(+)/NADH kinase [Actinomycetota bacterium]
MRVSVVVNADAGSVVDDPDRCRAGVVAAFGALGVDPEVELVGGDRIHDTVARAAKGADVVAVAGGDGTLSTAAAALAGGDVALAVLPLGTFNHLARDLGIPDDLEGAARVVVEGANRRIDLAEVGDRTFVNNSSIGLYPTMVDVRDRVRSARGWGKVRAVPVAAWHVLRRFPVRRIAIEAEGFARRLRTPFVFVGNNRYEVGPRGLGERVDLDSGELCLYVCRATSRWRLLRVAVAAVVRGEARTPDLEHWCGTEVAVDAPGHRILVAVDGEVDAAPTPLRYRIRPGALLVRAPTGTEPPPPAQASEPAVSGVDGI